MSKRADFELLCDIDESIRRIMSYLKEMTYDQFLKDLKTQDALVRNLEIIGEATKNLSDDFRKKNSEIAWKQLAGLRDRLIHHYFGLNFEVIWTITMKELPVLSAEINKIWQRNHKKESS